MKNTLRFLGLLLLLGCAIAQANIKQVTGLGSSAATIVQPGAAVQLITIQNNGSNNVRLTFDGGSTFTDNLGSTGTDPTTSTGYKLSAGQQVRITIMPGSGGIRKPIRAIMETGSTTLDICTDDLKSTFPTN